MTSTDDEIRAKQLAICEAAFDRQFETTWAMLEQVVEICNPSDETREKLLYGFRQYAKCWFTLGRVASESGVGAIPLTMNPVNI